MASVYEIVTQQILDQLAKGVVPWSRPWEAMEARNLLTNKPYRGINRILLAGAQYGSPYWLTYKQARQLGGHVRKGEKSTLVVFWKVELIPGEPHPEDPELTTAPKTRAILRYYRVFNLEQCEIPEHRLPAYAKGKPARKIMPCEQIVRGMPDAPPILEHPERAFYMPSNDQVFIPPQHQFESPEAYYHTLFHELTHSTGHRKRLNRESLLSIATWGNHSYSKEELVAELGAAFLCAKAGLQPNIQRSAAYVESWARVLSEHTRWIVWAASKAEQAAEYITRNAKHEPTPPNPKPKGGARGKPATSKTSKGAPKPKGAYPFMTALKGPIRTEPLWGSAQGDWVTNGFAAAKSAYIKPHAKGQPRPDLDVDQILGDLVNNPEPATVSDTVETQVNGAITVTLTTQSGEIYCDAMELAWMLKRLPDNVAIKAQTEPGAAFFEHNGEIIAVLMAMEPTWIDWR